MDLSLSVAIIAGLIFINTFFIIAALVKVMQTLSEARKLMEAARLQMAPITHDIAQIMSDIRSIVRSADREMDKIGEGVSAVRDTARNIKEFEQLIQERIERPLLDISAILSAIVKGGQVFWHNFSKR